MASKSSEQKAYEADLALISEAQAKSREAEKRERELMEAQERVREYEAKMEDLKRSKDRAEGFIQDVLGVKWTERDSDTLAEFPSAIAKQRQMDKLMLFAADGCYWENVPREFAKKMREAAQGCSDDGIISPAAILRRAAETLEGVS